ncbi:MBL fold metallo-hydrolase [Acinetobacter boissieri]|uniref:Glyoxylase, beta-lactamase superfamily II n=1 Tax=Acinetobacter boissieri TaxID=1219383 RepID=A0A1G6GZP1_9GAMM|nr:MBL fold metallo-hydrolase [Acinetobacter boissieri]SDB87530.1 Glyoxylase, beta-lactamase superfamily II [Acinetobacter boissieri]
MYIKQFFEPKSATYSYFLMCPYSKEAIIIDPVQCDLDKYLAEVKEHNANLQYIFETHIHADHITASDRLRISTQAKSVVHKNAGVECADIFMTDGCEFRFGEQCIKALATPGHTSACTSYYVKGYVFTGDTLLIGGCGRTDFQGGSAEHLYESVYNKLFTLPDETIVYPAHDYKGNLSSSIGHEKKYNLRLALGISKAQFINIMDHLDLAYPAQIDQALPANKLCGKSPRDYH